MAIEIARGATEIIVGTNPRIGGVYNGLMDESTANAYVAGVGTAWCMNDIYYASTTNDYSPCYGYLGNQDNAAGFTISLSGNEITIKPPLNAVLGTYSGIIMTNAYKSYLSEYSAWTVNAEYLDFSFIVVCMTVGVNVVKLSSSPVPNTNPVEYEHRYAVEAHAKGGIEPYNYSWSSSVGTLSASGSSGTLTVTNSDSNSGGVTGTVSCTVTDSGTCSDTGTASLADLGDIPNDGTGPEFDPGYGPGNGPTGGLCKVCPPLAVDNSAQQCGCKDAKGQPTCQGPNCPSPNGEHTQASPGTNIQRFSNYAGAGSTPTSYMIAR